MDKELPIIKAEITNIIAENRIDINKYFDKSADE